MIILGLASSFLAVAAGEVAEGADFGLQTTIVRMPSDFFSTEAAYNIQCNPKGQIKCTSLFETRRQQRQ